MPRISNSAGFEAIQLGKLLDAAIQTSITFQVRDLHVGPFDEDQVFAHVMALLKKGLEISLLPSERKLTRRVSGISSQ